MMNARNLAAGIAVVALVGTGAGVAGASGSAHHHHHWKAEVAKIEAIAKAGKLPAGFKCASAPKDLAQITKAETWIHAYLPKAEAREAAAVAAHKTKLAHLIKHRITGVEKFQSALITVSSLINAACT